MLDKNMIDYITVRSAAIYPRHEFWTMMYLLNRRAEIARLVLWATRKHLPGPRKYYQARLLDEEVRLSRQILVTPRFIVTLAYLVHNVNRLVFPPPHYLPKSSAAGYSSKNLTYSGKAYSMKRTSR